MISLISPVDSLTVCEYENCKRKLSIVSLKCRCGNTYCTKHKFFTDHNCTYDYKENHKNYIEKVNQKIVTDKLVKI